MIIIALSEVVGSDILKIGKVSIQNLCDLMTRLIKEINQNKKFRTLEALRAAST